MRPCLSSLLILPLLFANSNLSAQDSLDNLKDLQWQHRIVLLKPNADLDDWLHQLNRANPEVLDRDILWFTFDGESYKSNYKPAVSENFISDILERFFSNEATRTVLIGKDGGVKDASGELNLPELFALIDGMPMRRAEMREDSN